MGRITYWLKKWSKKLRQFIKDIDLLFDVWIEEVTKWDDKL